MSTVSLELAQKLREAGWPQDPETNQLCYPGGFKWLLVSHWYEKHTMTSCIMAPDLLTVLGSNWMQEKGWLWWKTKIGLWAAEHFAVDGHDDKVRRGHIDWANDFTTADELVEKILDSILSQKEMQP